MILFLLILIFLFALAYVRYLNNEDLIMNNCKTDIDVENAKNAKKVFRKEKLYNILFLAALLILILLMICNFTDIDAKIIDYFSTDFYVEQAFDYNLYFIPIYIIAIREILIQVKIGEFLLKFFKAKEPVLEENLLKTLLYKKPKPTNEQNNEQKK